MNIYLVSAGEHGVYHEENIEAPDEKMAKKIFIKKYGLQEWAHTVSAELISPGKPIN